ncbi:MAG: indolepyruvate oxidoreductase subunit beta, partial [Gammaproteobacteria bacterium]|nr:indolepyruvate oxidoreductase subunit beta [Gammaproteobacteria bacterium]
MPSRAPRRTDKTPSVPAIQVAEKPVNVLVVGVGGQGVIMVSKVLATLCQRQGYQVKQSEVHGMAKRGGSVFSHVRFGETVYSPTIPLGEADVLVALEWAEGLRWLSYLKPETGIFIADTQQIVPPFACRNRQHGAGSGYARETVADVIDQVANCYAINAGQIAQELGNSKAGNTMLLGMMSTTLDFPADDWREAIRMFAPPKAIDINMQAFERGRDWVETHDPADLDPNQGGD